MERLLLVRYGEIFLKGLNRPFFEQLLLKRTNEALAGFPGVKVTMSLSRFFVAGYAEGDERAIIGRLRGVFGLHSVCPAVKTDKEFGAVCEASLWVLLRILHRKVRKFESLSWSFSLN